MLNKICGELIKASNATLDSPLKPCTGTFRSTMSANLTLQKQSPASSAISHTYVPILATTPTNYYPVPIRRMQETKGQHRKIRPHSSLLKNGQDNV
ncbi:20766_t:CDS:2, partial [Gigaspora rosea]